MIRTSGNNSAKIVGRSVGESVSQLPSCLALGKCLILIFGRLERVILEPGAGSKQLQTGRQTGRQTETDRARRANGMRQPAHSCDFEAPAPALETADAWLAAFMRHPVTNTPLTHPVSLQPL